MKGGFRRSSKRLDTLVVSLRRATSRLSNFHSSPVRRYDDKAFQYLRSLEIYR